MSGERNVFDEYGNYLGKFVPVGGGEGCLFLIALLPLIFIGFLIYGMIKVVVEGFKAAKNGDWKKALVYWSIPVLIVLSPICAAAVSVPIAVVQRLEQQEREKELTSWARANPNQALTISRLRGGIVLYPERCGAPCYGMVYGEYKVTNNMKHVTVYPEESPWGCGYEGEIDPRIPNLNWHQVSPGKTLTAFCPEMDTRYGKPVRTVLLFWAGWNDKFAEFCLRNC